jgi:GTP-binding protein
MLPTVAIVGRPNVGKSTLFNRLIGKRLALVDDTPGVTRDRREGEGRLGPLKFRVIDTAGLEEADEGTMERRMRQQTETAVIDADVALFMVDARAGLTPMDRHFADWLRRQDKPVLLVANKTEGRQGEMGAMEAWELGLGEPILISAEHGEGLSGLYDAIVAALPPEAVEDDEDETDGAEGGPIQIAIVGRPNAGKSTLINHLIGSDRLLTGPEAGLTRDSIAVPWEWEGRRFKLVDTAGMRRKSRVEGKLEKLSVAESLRAIRLAQVVVLVLDGNLGIDKQDLTIADHVINEGRALVIAVNKWDAVEDRAMALQAIEDRLQISLPQVKGVPVVTLSALTGRHTERLLPAVIRIYESWNKRVSTGALNRWLEEVTERHPPPAVNGRRLRLRYGTQIKSRPPTFAFFVTRPAELPDSYARYLANSLREVFDMPGTVIRVVLRKQKNPYVDDDGEK